MRIHVANEQSKQIGLRVKKLRLVKAMTQRELGKVAMISPNHISNIENGVENVSDDAVARLATALETSFLFLKEGNIVALNKDTKKRNSLRERKNVQCQGQLSFADLGYM
jgi:transcriptional regulator with XRE-family HTH domain